MRCFFSASSRPCFLGQPFFSVWTTRSASPAEDPTVTQASPIGVNLGLLFESKMVHSESWKATPIFGGRGLTADRIGSRAVGKSLHGRRARVLGETQPLRREHRPHCSRFRRGCGASIRPGPSPSLAQAGVEEYVSLNGSLVVPFPGAAVTVLDKPLPPEGTESPTDVAQVFVLQQCQLRRGPGPHHQVVEQLELEGTLDSDTPRY